VYVFVRVFVYNYILHNDTLIQDSTEWCSEVGEELEMSWTVVVAAGLWYYPTVCME
jgi:hypothetical protein